MTTTFLDLPFELQSLILTSAFTTALDLDLSAGVVRAYHTTPSSSVPGSQGTSRSHQPHLISIDKLSPMHQCTHTYTLFTRLLPLTLPYTHTPDSSNLSLSLSTTVSSSSSEPGDCSTNDNDDTLLISPNQLIHALLQVRKALQRDAEATKAQMREIVLRHPWARVAGETYCSLWRRKERAVVVGEVVGAALAVVQGDGKGQGKGEGKGNGGVSELGAGEEGMKEGLGAEKEASLEMVEVVSEEEEEKGRNEGFLVGEMVARCYQEER